MELENRAELHRLNDAAYTACDLAFNGMMDRVLKAVYAECTTTEARSDAELRKYVSYRLRSILHDGQLHWFMMWGMSQFQTAFNNLTIRDLQWDSDFLKKAAMAAALEAIMDRLESRGFVRH
jgi:hypothetical protein